MRTGARKGVLVMVMVMVVRLGPRGNHAMPRNEEGEDGSRGSAGQNLVCFFGRKSDEN